MDTLLESIRAAIATSATPEARCAGATACRTILAALEATPGQPFAPVAIAPPSASAVAGMVSALRGASPDQLLELAIARLRAALPAGVDVPPVAPLKLFIPTKLGGQP